MPTQASIGPSLLSMTMDAPRNTMPPAGGAITAFTLVDSNGAWQVGYTATAAGGNGDSLFSIDSVSQSGGGSISAIVDSAPSAISAVDQTGKIFTIGEQTGSGEAVLPKTKIGAHFLVQGSTGNDGTYTITDVVDDPDTFSILVTVAEAIPDATADGVGGTAGVVYLVPDAGDLSSELGSGQYFGISGSTGNDGTRISDISGFDGTNTWVIPTFDNTISNSTADGSLALFGTITTVSLVIGGSGYAVADGVALSGNENGFSLATINITAVS